MRVEDSFPILIVLVIGILVVAFVLQSRYSKKREKEERRQRRDELLEEMKAFLQQVNIQKSLTAINTDVLLKKSEEAFLSDDTTLMETRSVRSYQSGGVGFRVAKGVYVGGGRGSSESHPEWRAIDNGRLVLTSQRLIFNGSNENRNIQLAKIFSVEPFIDAIEISSEGKTKNMLFSVPNPYIWAAVIKILSKAEDPKHLGNVQLDLTVINTP